MSNDNGWTRTLSRERQIADRQIVLEARVLRLHLPFGGLMWSAPVAVRVHGPSGEERLPIRDVTRRWQIAAYGFSIICILFGLAARRPK